MCVLGVISLELVERVLGFRCGEQVLTALLSPYPSSRICRWSSAWSRSPRSSQGPSVAASSSGLGSLCCCSLPVFPLHHLATGCRLSRLFSPGGN